VSATATSEPVVILIPPESVTASIAASHLRDELEVSSRVEPALDLDLEAVVSRARQVWPDSVVIVLDPKKNETWLLRPGEDKLVVRSLEKRSDVSPYALAVAAAELVRISLTERHRPPEEAPVAAPEPPAARDLEIALSVGFGLAASPGFEGALAEPVLGLDLRLGSAGFWSSIGVRARGPSSASAAKGEAIVDYDRTDLSLRIAFGPEHDPWIFTALLEVGASITNATAVRGSDLLGEASRVPFWVGGGVDLEYKISSLFRAASGIEIVRVLSPADYLGSGEAVFSEGAWRVQASLGARWIP
jgi:hypothetical protein